MYKDICEKVDSIIRQNNAGKKFVVFGAGEIASDFLAHTSLKEDIIEILDNDSKKAGKMLSGIEIHKVHEIEDDIVIIIASMYDKSISAQINEISSGKCQWISLPFVMEYVKAYDARENNRIKTVMIESTNYCNAKCEFCSNPTLKRKKMHMPNDIFELVIKRLKEENITPEIFRLHCLGEPLLDPNLYNKIKRLKSEFKNCKVGFTTNFSLAENDVIDNLLESGLDFITISLNAIEKDSYEKIMKLDFEKTVKNIKLFLNKVEEVKSDIDITLSIVDTYEDKNIVEEFIRQWKTYNINVRVMREGKWIETTAGAPLCGSMNTINNHILAGRICSQLYEEICILSNGDYGLCCFDGEGLFDKANVSNMSIADALNIPLRVKLGDEMLYTGKTSGICENCSFRVSK